MAHALQVSFRRIPPKESLISLAAEHYRQIRLVHPTSEECVVSLEAAEDHPRALTRAWVRIESASGGAEAVVQHKNVRMALELALQDVRHQLRATLAPAPAAWAAR